MYNIICLVSVIKNVSHRTEVGYFQLLPKLVYIELTVVQLICESDEGNQGTSEEGILSINLPFLRHDSLVKSSMG